MRISTRLCPIDFSESSAHPLTRGGGGRVVQVTPGRLARLRPNVRARSRSSSAVRAGP
jgi:hypothetical protein